MEKHNLTQLRVTQTQNLVLHDIPENIVTALNDDLQSTGFKSDAFQLFDGKDAVACPGNWTCRLGITNSRQLAQNLDDGDIDMKVHISGCHNGCAQPQLAEIGLHGEAKRMFGKLIPYYQMYFAGSGIQGGEFGMKGPEIPASRAEHAVKLVKRTFEADHATLEKFIDWAKRKGISFFSELLEDVTMVTADDLPFLLKDVGSENEFKVLQLGGGECAGIAEETVASQLAEANYEKGYRDIFTRQADVPSALDCAENMLRLVGKSILFGQGATTGKELSEILLKMRETLTEYTSVVNVFESLLVKLNEIRGSADAQQLLLFSENLDKWISRLVVDNSIVLVADKNTKIEKVAVANDESAEEHLPLDLSKEVCPMHYIKARQALRSVGNGSSLKMIVMSGGDQKLVTDSLNSVGFNVSIHEEINADDQIVLLVKKPLQWNEKDNKRTAGSAVA